MSPEEVKYSRPTQRVLIPIHDKVISLFIFNLFAKQRLSYIHCLPSLCAPILVNGEQGSRTSQKTRKTPSISRWPHHLRYADRKPVLHRTAARSPKGERRFQHSAAPIVLRFETENRQGGIHACYWSYESICVCSPPIAV
jgi:hypothetical protein